MKGLRWAIFVSYALLLRAMRSLVRAFKYSSLLGARSNEASALCWTVACWSVAQLSEEMRATWRCRGRRANAASGSKTLAALLNPRAPELAATSNTPMSGTT